ncbi:MAG: sensor histidine kinase [Anaerorhabdus sp.]
MWSRLINTIKNKSLFIQISITAAIAIVIATTTASLFVLNLSEKVYLDAYRDFNDKIIGEISTEYYQLHEDVVNVLTTAQQSQSVKEYLTNSNLSSLEENRIIYNMQKQVKNYAILNQKVSSNMMIVGLNGKKYSPGSGLDSDSPKEILDSDIVKDALLNPNKITYYYATGGFSKNTKNLDVVIVIKVLKDYYTKENYGVAIITMSENEFSSFYDSLIDSKINKIYCIDKNGVIVSSNSSGYVGKVDEELNKFIEVNDKNKYSKVKYLDGMYSSNIKVLPYMNFELLSMIDESALIKEVNFFLPVIAFTVLSSLLFTIIVVMLIRKYFQPLNTIIDHVPTIIEGDFDSLIEVNSSGEIMELADAFNYMLDGLNSYVDNVVKLEKEKKLSEIHALQMQINPHFVYNTLTSIKFLIWQKKNDQAIIAMDAFIELLRNTIGNDEEYSSVKKEIENMKNYVKIQNIRYNDKVSVSYHISEGCEDIKIIKMLMQPFVENSFIHAFKEEEFATINIFISVKSENLIIEVIDNGKGIEKDKLSDLFNCKSSSMNGLSGLGIKNVNDRIKLLYGDNYGVSVSSVISKGTIVTIKLPII